MIFIPTFNYIFLIFGLWFRFFFSSLSGVGKAFGFSVPPRVDLNFSARGDKKAPTSRSNQSRRVEGSDENKQGGRKDFGSSGHAFSADNPYGKKAAGDKRQFSR